MRFHTRFVLLLCILALHAVAVEPPKAIRLANNPIITPLLGAGIGANINGPSLIRVPEWLTHPLGRYYLYFADHNGTYIRLAYADDLRGPWKIHAPGTLRLEETMCSGHIASPDVHVDNQRKEIHMYFHGPVKDSGQLSFLAISKDGLHFKASSERLGDSYFRIFQWRGKYYAMARAGKLYRSNDGLSGFEEGLNPLDTAVEPSRARHVALDLRGDTLRVFYSRIGDDPESILMSQIQLLSDWKKWKASESTAILTPEMEYEGASQPRVPSKIGAAQGPVRQLRDPAVFRDGTKTFLLYSVAGESGIAIAELR